MKKIAILMTLMVFALLTACTDNVSPTLSTSSYTGTFTNRQQTVNVETYAGGKILSFYLKLTSNDRKNFYPAGNQDSVCLSVTITSRSNKIVTKDFKLQDWSKVFTAISDHNYSGKIIFPDSLFPRYYKCGEIAFTINLKKSGSEAVAPLSGSIVYNFANK